MNDLTAIPLPDAAVFSARRPTSLAALVARVGSEMTATARRDTLSALRVLAEKAGLDLQAVPATAEAVRPLLEALTAPALGVSPKRLANIRSLVTRAVERHGAPRTWITRSITPAPEWQALLATVPKREYAWSLSRLACYCTAKGLDPAAVSPETLVGLLAALEAECVSRKPRSIIKQTIAIWNMCVRQVPTWPQVVLASPTKSEPFMLPLAAFPESFRADIAAWETRMTAPDPFDASAPLKPLRPDTLASCQLAFWRVASALVRRRVLRVDGITGLDVLVEPENLKQGLRAFLPDGERRGLG